MRFYQFTNHYFEIIRKIAHSIIVTAPSFSISNSKILVGEINKTVGQSNNWNCIDLSPRVHNYPKEGND